MTLKDAFREFSLTDGQEKLVDELEEFFQNKTPCFILKGYAGTGKTFMMKGVSDWLALKKRSFKIAAPTGRAAKVISQKTKYTAYTIHKTIYSNTDIQEFKIMDEDGTETFKFYYGLQNNSETANTVYIIDESSMISNAYSEGEFFRFGSGYLLNDFMTYVNIDNNDHNKKIIFIGDNAQLPPVGMNFSPALDSEYLKQHFNLAIKEYELTEVVRQKADSGILFNATKIRLALNDNIFNQINIHTGFEDITRLNNEEMLTTYLQACKNHIDDETIVVAYSNNSVREYNDFIRSYFFPNQNFISEGDKIILVANNYNYPEMELLNGDFGIVKQVFHPNERRNIKIKKKSKSGNITEEDIALFYRDVVIMFTDVEGKPHDIQCKIIENLLYSNQRDLSSNELKAIYIDFKIRNKNLVPATKPFKDVLRKDPYFNALRIKFGYAVTCHKAQGGEWKNTFINCTTSMGYFNASYYRWLYTGITRAKEHLFTLNEPHYNIDSLIMPPKSENITVRQDLIILGNDLMETEIPFQLPLENQFLKCIYLVVQDVMKDSNIQISAIRHTSYLEHYTFIQGSEIAVFKVHYNNHQKVTKIEKPVITSVLSEIIYGLLKTLENKTIVSNESEEINHFSDNSCQCDEAFQQEFYEALKEKMNPAKIIITGIEHKPYHEIYYFKRDGLTAAYKFWYDGKKIFKKTEIIATKSTGLIEEINSLLK